MKYIDEFRTAEAVRQVVEAIHKTSHKELRIMEVCGGHTMAIHKFGIPSLLPDNIKLLSGPGCPVCVSSRQFIDQAIAYGRLDNVILTTFGDLIRVPGSTSSLEKEKADGRRIEIVYSILDALKLAHQNPDKKVVFLGIGFETTAPGTAAGIMNAAKEGLSNFFVYSSHKVMPPALKALITEGVKIDGYIGPGHVSTITGIEIYEELITKYNVGCVISGFEPLDLLQSIYLLVKQKEENKARLERQYRRAVREDGNPKARQIMFEVFDYRDDWWRGLGILPLSGLGIKDSYALFDAEKQFTVEVEKTRSDAGCICGEILKGLKSPPECKLFGTVCKPVNPVGACMVSSEGACHAFYKYSNYNI